MEGTNEAPEILRFGPVSVRPGEEFNKQANGDSVMWFKVRNVNNNLTVKIDDTVINSFSGGDLITASIPRKYYITPGEHKIYLVDSITGMASNVVIFTIK